MKNIFRTLLVCSTLLLTSCSSDDDAMSNTSGNLLGTWIGETVNYTGSIVTETQGQSITNDNVGEGFDVDYTLTFSENPNEAHSMGSYSVNLSITTLGQTQTVTQAIPFFDSVYSWDRTGNVLTLTDGEGVISEITIVSLTDSYLELNTLSSEVNSSGGVTMTTTVNLTTTFTR